MDVTMGNVSNPVVIFRHPFLSSWGNPLKASLSSFPGDNLPWQILSWVQTMDEVAHGRAQNEMDWPLSMTLTAPGNWPDP